MGCWCGRPDKAASGAWGDDPPALSAALEALEFEHVHSLESTIREYTAADIEATITLYEADVGRGYVPTYTRRD